MRAVASGRRRTTPEYADVEGAYAGSQCRPSGRRTARRRYTSMLGTTSQGDTELDHDTGGTARQRKPLTRLSLGDRVGPVKNASRKASWKTLSISSDRCRCSSERRKEVYLVADASGFRIPTIHAVGPRPVFEGVGGASCNDALGRNKSMLATVVNAEHARAHYTTSGERR